MSKTTFNFDDVPNVVLLRELLRRHGNDTIAGDEKLYLSDVNSAPNKIEFLEKHYEVIIGIGKDNHAKIYLTQDDVNALNDVLEIKESE